MTCSYVFPATSQVPLQAQRARLGNGLETKPLPIRANLKVIEEGCAEWCNVCKKTMPAVSLGAPTLTHSTPLALLIVAAGSADTSLVIASRSTNVVVHSETIENEACSAPGVIQAMPHC
jgi:hypothetical protein